MKTIVVVILAILLMRPAVLLSQESQPKRSREPTRTQQAGKRPPQSQTKERPAARPQGTRKKVGKKPKSTVPRRRSVPRVRDEARDQEKQRQEPSRRAPEPRKKPPSTVRRKPPAPRKTDEAPTGEMQRPKPSRRLEPSPSNVNQPSRRQPIEKSRPTRQDLVPEGGNLRMLIRREQREIFESTESAISRASIRSMTTHLAPKVYISITGGESGYFSANQAQYVLENYFVSHRPVGFSFSSYGESYLNPYATGHGSFVYRGSRHDAQVYVSLTQKGTRWVISQINIY